MTSQKERPILFSAPMVRALLAGTKTQTRRTIKLKTGDTFDERALLGAIQEYRPVFDKLAGAHVGRTSVVIRCPYGMPGDKLWVREAHALHERFTDVVRVAYSASLPGAWSEAHQDFPARLADGLKIKPLQQGFRPSIHMPRWASRITLRVTDVRVQRLNEISEADAIAEGCPGRLGPNPDFPDEWDPSPTEEYRELWETINGSGSWVRNPWVWAVSFEVEPAYVG